MCGIVGMAGNTNLAHMKMFRNLLLLDIIRGWDSTGVAVVEAGKKEMTTEKDVGTPNNLWDWNDSKILDNKGVPKFAYRAVMGHNRAATKGKIIPDNAHPFTYGGVTGCHNGTLRDWASLEGYQDFDVDSKALIKTIADKGIDHAWKSFTGAAAVCYWDSDKQQLGLIRNSLRPLHITFSEDGKTVFWASEEWMLRVASNMAKVKIAPKNKAKEGETPRPDIIQLKEDTLHLFDVSWSNAILREVRELEKKKLPVSNTNNGGRTGTIIYGFPNSSKKSFKGHPMNDGWAKGLDKEDATFRDGQNIGKFVGMFSHKNSDNSFFKGAILELNDGRYVEVYPSTESEYQVWLTRDRDCFRTYYFKIDHRPRISRKDNGKFWRYRVSHRGATMTGSVSSPTEKKAT